MDVSQELRAPRDTCSWWRRQGLNQLAVAGDVGLEVDCWDSAVTHRTVELLSTSRAPQASHSLRAEGSAAVWPVMRGLFLCRSYAVSVGLVQDLIRSRIITSEASIKKAPLARCCG